MRGYQHLSVYAISRRTGVEVFDGATRALRREARLGEKCLVDGVQATGVFSQLGNTHAGNELHRRALPGDFPRSQAAIESTGAGGFSSNDLASLRRQEEFRVISGVEDGGKLNLDLAVVHIDDMRCRRREDGRGNNRGGCTSAHGENEQS